MTDLYQQPQVERKCPICQEKLYSVSEHSIGELHSVCLKCHFCPDCDDGAV